MPQMTNTSVVAEDRGKASLPSFFAGHWIGGRLHFEDCEPISDSEFKVLMALVAIATFAFGCVVNGWLL